MADNPRASLRKCLFVFLLIFCLLVFSDPAMATDERTYRATDIQYLTETESLCQSTSYGSGSTAASVTMESFLEAYIEDAFTVGTGSAIPYEAILAQAALESGYGKSKLTQEANNFFGIKAGSSWTGEVYTIRTREETSSGGSYYVTADFRKYPSPEAGFIGYVDFIRNSSRYSKALDYPNDPYQYIVEIKNAGYATDTRYISKVHSLIDKVISYAAESGSYPPSSTIDYSQYGATQATGYSGGGCTVSDVSNGSLGDEGYTTVVEKLLASPGFSTDSNIELEDIKTGTGKCIGSYPGVDIDVRVVRLMLSIIENSGAPMRVSSVVSDHNCKSNSGNISNHSRGLGFDIGNEEDAEKIFKYLYVNRVNLEINELIFSTDGTTNQQFGGYNLRGGQHHSYSSSVTRGHRDHIHVSVKNNGV